MAQKRFVGIGREDSGFGSVAGVDRWIETVENITPDQNWIIPPPVADRSYRKKNLGPYRGRGNLGEFDVEPENIGELISAVMGSGSDTKTNPTGSVFKHTFKPKDTLISYTVRVGVELETIIYAGCLCNSLRIRWPHEDNIKALANILHAGAAPNVTTLATPSLSELQAFPASPIATLEIDNVDRAAIIYDGEITIDNKIPSRGSLESRFMPKIRQGDRPVTGKLSAYFETTDLRTAFLSGNEFELDMLWEGPIITGAYKYYLRTFLPKCVFLRDTLAHIRPISEPLVVDAPFQAFYDSATQAEIVIELQNTVSDTY